MSVYLCLCIIHASRERFRISVSVCADKARKRMMLLEDSMFDVSPVLRNATSSVSKDTVATAATVGAPSQSKDVGRTSGASSVVARSSTGRLSAASTSPSSQRSVN